MSLTQPARTRIAPSPTGLMHIGTLRTMLYDYFLARQSGGQFIVRIEDTDQEREVPGAREALLGLMNRLGLDYDEGLVLNEDGTLGEKGPYGPYVQSQRLHIYRQYAQQLLDAGHAYYCFCSPERLTKMREEQAALKLPPKYDRACLKIASEEARARVSDGEPHVVRMRVPEGACSFVDAIRGPIEFQNNEVDDQVLMKSDGFPTYHLAVVVDDYLMKITHVLRGEEWISSTPKQILLHQMLGIEMPVYAHLPLLLNPDKTKLSKRKGDVAAEVFLDKGYLPEALMNFLATLGWNPTDDREIFSRAELTELFELRNVNRAGAVVNMEKLDWVNAQYIRAMSRETYLSYALAEIKEMKLPSDIAFVERVVWLLRERIQRFPEIREMVEAFFTPPAVDATLLPWKTQSVEEVRERLEGVYAWLESRSEEALQAPEDVEAALKEFIMSKGWKNGDVLWPTRVALSGAKESPSPFELIYAFGQKRSLERLTKAIKSLK